MIMKKIITLFLALLFATAAAEADTKVIERSAKKAPDWLGGAPEGCLIVTAEGATLSAAQENALNEIIERVIKAVASNVSLTQRNEAVEIVTDDGVQSSDSYTTSSVIRSANLPFIKGISLSKAADTYWVRVQDKKTKKEHYEYSVKYPLTRLELETMIAEFEELDKEREQELVSLEEAIASVAEYDAIKAAVGRLDALADYFVDPPRIARVQSAKTRYKDLYSSIVLSGAVVSDGKIKCALTLNGHKLRYFAAPTLRSNCASDLSFTNTDGEYVITFNTQDCLPEEQNSVEVSFRINGRTLRRSFTIGAGAADGGSQEAQVFPTGRIYLTADSISAENETVSGLNVRLTLDNRGGTPFGLKSIELNVPGIATPVVFDDMDTLYSTKGVIQVKARAEGTLRLRPAAQAAFINGRINIVDPATGGVRAIRLSLPYSTNWK